MTADVNWKDMTKENEVSILDQLKWLNLHRYDTTVIAQGDKKKAVLRIPILCRMLDQDKEGKYFCKDYNNRPQVCREFVCQRASKGTPIKS